MSERENEMSKMIELFEQLTGQPVPFKKRTSVVARDFFSKGPLGCSQFNEIMLVLGYDRVSQDFFEYFFGEAIASRRQLEEGVEKFRKLAMLKFGNFKFAFKRISVEQREMIEETFKEFRFEQTKLVRFTDRCKPLLEIEEIKPEDAYYLGYIVDEELRQKKKKLRKGGQSTSEIDARIERMKEIRSKGMRNHETYLISDHIDVYIATSMRYRHEFVAVSNFIRKLFGHEKLRKLNLRWYDPTQVYCRERIDKGLSEGLMLKRAKCTIYHAQEADTFGKDSELATTLVQGKPVICFVPNLTDKKDFMRWIENVLKLDNIDALLNVMKHYYPNGAWKDKKVRNWLEGKLSPPREEVLAMIYQKAREMYENRAKALKEFHPLGLQVNLATGVANGVLVVRKVRECAELLYDVLVQKLEFEIEELPHIFVLREKKTGSVYRVVTKDALLTNSFWNFYLQEP
jgi:hypothetical protein